MKDFLKGLEMVSNEDPFFFSTVNSCCYFFSAFKLQQISEAFQHQTLTITINDQKITTSISCLIIKPDFSWMYLVIITRFGRDLKLPFF